MKKNYLKAILLILLVLPILSGMISLGFMNYKVSKLKDHFTVFNVDKKQYELVKKKPSSWVTLNQVSNVGRWAIIISEDWAFYDHEGLDFNQITEVLEESLSEGKLVRGASTITQQVAKNSLLSNEKSLKRKFLEAIYAKLMEGRLTKDQILEHYLNLVELGENIYGISAASQFYFKIPPSKLSAKQAAFLAMLLPSPVRYAQSYREGNLTDFASEQISKILIKLRQARIINEEERVDAESEVLPFALLNHFDDDLFSVENESY